MKLQDRVAAVALLVAVLSYAAIPTASAADDESLAVRCAKAQLRLAELGLQKIHEMNRKVPGTLTSSVVSLFAAEVEQAKTALALAQKNDGDPFQTALMRAELAVKSADGSLKRAIEANARVPGAMSATDLERVQLRVEIAKLRLEQGRALADAGSEKKLAWQLDLLTDELSSIKQQTYLLGQNRLSPF